MKLILRIILLPIILSSVLIGQKSNIIDSIKTNFEQNDYQSVISISNEMLKLEISATNEEMINIYLMRSVSYFALSNKDSAKINYIEILKLNKNFEPDPVLISPKIIKFFKPIKADYNQITKEKFTKSAGSDSLENIKQTSVSNSITSSVIKNIVLPGWGHFNSPGTAKAIIITTLSTGLLTSSAYFIIRTEDLHDNYLHESNHDRIPAKYDEYNQSFKTRNILLISYAAVWLYSILDVWLFSADDFIQFDVIRNDDPRSSHLTNGLQIKLTMGF